jgi:hypothetical protein
MTAQESLESPFNDIQALAAALNLLTPASYRAASANCGVVHAHAQAVAILSRLLAFAQAVRLIFLSQSRARM